MLAIDIPDFLDESAIKVLDECYSRDKAELRLYEFVKQAWSTIEGGNEFCPGWHLEVLCAHLECVADYTIKKLLVNVPPRTSKSTIIGCLFPAWVWTTRPGRRIVNASYSMPISQISAIKCRRIVSSKWYQDRWGHMFKLVGDQNTKTKFENSERGNYSAVSVGGTLTGLGGDLKICDDPNNASDKNSEAKRSAANLWRSIAWSTRFNNPSQTSEVVVQQRLHVDDYTGSILGGENADDWVKLILPMRFVRDRRAKTIVLPGTDRVWEDPREKEGELLWPQRIDEKKLAEIENELRAVGGEYEISGQMQQMPAPDDGGILKKSQFRWWKEERSPKLKLTVSSWDTAIETNELAAYSAVITWGLFDAPDGVPAIIFLGMWQGKLESPELLKLAVNLHKDYRDNGENDITPDNLHETDITLVEAKASGSPLIQNLRRRGVNAIKFQPEGDKTGRARAASVFMESGQVWVPAKPPDFIRLRPAAAKFVDSCAMFPMDKTRDIVDSFSQAVEYFRRTGHLRNRFDVKAKPSKPYEFDLYHHKSM